MKIPNLKELIISLTDFKKHISEIIAKNSTKVIMRNNEPVSIFMPYSDYLAMNQSIKGTGEDITLSNGVQIKVCVEKSEDDIIIKTYIKMKTSGEYKLYFTHYISNPNFEQTLTTEEILQLYDPVSKK